MSCRRCDELLATYRRDVTLFGNVVLKVAGAIGDDSRLAVKEMELEPELQRDQ